MSGGTCSGCDAPLRSSNGMDFWVEREIAPGVTAKLCASGRYMQRVAKRSCLSAARKELQLCPGCGAAGWEPGTICLDCRKWIERGRQAEKRKLEQYLINGRGLMPYTSGDDHRALAELLGRMMAGGEAGIARASDLYEGNVKEVFPRHDSDKASSGQKWLVELTADQAAALREFTALVRRLTRLHYKNGFEKGMDLLRGLAAGKLTTESFDRTKADVAKYDPNG